MHLSTNSGACPVVLRCPEHVRDDEGTLLFKGVTHTDKGFYTCVASNSQGRINATIYIDVVSEYGVIGQRI